MKRFIAVFLLGFLIINPSLAADGEPDVPLIAPIDEDIMDIPDVGEFKQIETPLPTEPQKSDVAIKPELTATISENAPKTEEKPAEKIPEMPNLFPKDGGGSLPPDDNAPKGDTWIDQLSATSAKDVSLEGMVDKVKQTKAKARSNASVFDISGIMLRMSLDQVEKTLQTRGFQKTSQKLEIPNFIRWRNEDYCRNQGVVGYERLASCVIEMAKKDKHEYIETIEYAKFNTKEEVTVKFTSNFTKNKAYKISYKSAATDITGNSQKAIYIRNIKIYDFWKLINQKYGVPDDKETVTWGLGGNKPYMQAATGRLVLEDPMLRELDYTRMSREDQRYMNTSLYNF